MNAASRKALTDQLSALSVETAADLRRKILNEPAIRARAKALHAAERVGAGFELWTDLLSRRAAVMWVLRSVYLRVLEDRGLMNPGRILDRESEMLFHALAPDLGETAYLRWIYRDLAKKESGLAELFASTPAEVAEPSDALSRRLLDFWRSEDPDTGTLLWRFDQEDFDSRLLGDLYQDLDPVVKQRYALLQTPDFVVDFILDETLSPAIAHWDIQTVRLIDPACGSGHFLLAAFDRLFTGLRTARPDMSPAEAARHVLDRVVGIDLNDYACALARARLLMHALEASGSKDLADAADLHPQVFWADGLDQVELDELGEAVGETQQLGFGEEYGMARAVVVKGKPSAMLTPIEVREQLRPVLEGGFHAVVANPPYITEKDPARKKYHKEQVVVGGRKRARYVSAYMKYSLGCPFTERCFQLATKADGGGFVGIITSNSFIKRSFGRALIEEFMPTVKLTMVVDTSGAHIPGHGTPTVLLFGRDALPEAAMPVRAVMGKRGEPNVPEVAAEGLVWSSIVRGHASPDFENEFISIDDLGMAVFTSHPWSLKGGMATSVQQAIETNSGICLSEECESIGITSFTLEDGAYCYPMGCPTEQSVERSEKAVMIRGENVRDWAVTPPFSVALLPYDSEFEVVDQLSKTLLAALWPYRSTVSCNMMFGGKTKIETGLKWYEFGRLTAHKLKTPLSIVFANIATHNHFVLDRGGHLFNTKAPVIKLPAGATEDDHLVLLGQLNSSTACFWMKQVFFTKGGPGGKKISSQEYENFFEHDSTKLLGFPLISESDARILGLSTALDETANRAAATSLARVLESEGVTTSAGLSDAVAAHHQAEADHRFRMTALQEELDWLNYALYNVDPDIDFLDPAVAPLPPDSVPPLRPGLRPFEILLARQDADLRAAIERGETPSQMPTQWFARHGWEPVTDTAAIEDADYRARVEARLALIEQSKALQLLEQPTYKRRWYKPDYEAEEREALDLWLADRLEDWAKTESSPWTLAQAAVAMEADAAVRAVCELRTGRPDYSLVAELARLVEADSVPNNKYQVYKAKGLEKRAAWEHTWQLQHAEDRGEKVDVPVPPKYGSGDFAKTSYWRLRGKLDVPKERFVAFAEMPDASGERRLYGWAGWTPLQRAEQLLGLYESAANQGLGLERCYGLLYGVWFLLPWVAWEDAAAASEFRVVVQDLVGAAGLTEGLLAQWAAGEA